MAERLAALLDAKDAVGGSMVKVYGLKAASAPDVAQALQTMFARQRAEQVFVFGDRTMNSVLVRADAGAADRFEQVRRRRKPLDCAELVGDERHAHRVRPHQIKQAQDGN